MASRRRRLLLLNVAVVSTCALVYELVAATLASYLLGDAVAQFSIVIGTYLAAMGAGAALSGRIGQAAPRRFVEAELVLAVVGGATAPMLLLAYDRVPHFAWLLHAHVFVVGALVGLELPLLMRLLSAELGSRELLSRAFAFDHVGSLVGALLFPIVLVPVLGVVRTSLVVGLVNVVVAFSGTWLLRPQLARVAGYRAVSAVVAAALVFALFRSDAILALAGD